MIRLPTCRDFLKELSEFLDESCDPGLRQELEKHVSQCPNCFVILDTTKRTLQVYKGMEPQAIPSDVESKLMRALEMKMSAKTTQA
jgi:anti-sigma factor (TIGR02949 family)